MQIFRAGETACFRIGRPLNSPNGHTAAKKEYEGQDDCQNKNETDGCDPDQAVQTGLPGLCLCGQFIFEH